MMSNDNVEDTDLPTPLPLPLVFSDDFIISLFLESAIGRLPIPKLQSRFFIPHLSVQWVCTQFF